jgi:hypothetical protein
MGYDIHFSCVKGDGLWLLALDLETGCDTHFSFSKVAFPLSAYLVKAEVREEVGIYGFRHHRRIALLARSELDGVWGLRGFLCPILLVGRSYSHLVAFFVIGWR